MGLFLMAFIVSAASGEAGEALVSRDLRVEFDAHEGGLVVIDRRNGFTWRQVNALRSSLSVSCPAVRADPWRAERWPADTAPIVIEERGAFNTGFDEPLRAQVRLARHGGAVHIRAEVEDGQTVLSKLGRERYWQSDSLELWFGAEQLTLVLTEGPAVEARWLRNGASKAAVKARAELRDGGYVIEASVPLGDFEALQAVGDEGGAAPFALCLNSADEPGQRVTQVCFPASWRFGDVGSSAQCRVAGPDGALPKLSASPCDQRLLEIDAEAGLMRLTATLPAVRKEGARDFVQVPITAALDGAPSDLSLTFEADLEGEWREMRYPFVFYLDGPEAQVVLPHCEGMLTPARTDDPHYLNLGRDYVYSGYGTFLAGWGLLDQADGKGVFTYVDTPVLAGYQTAEVARGGHRAASPALYWRADKHRFTGERRLTYAFAPRGGHVALANAYRRLYDRDWPSPTLREKAKTTPQVEKLAGAPVFWVFDTPGNTLAVAKMLKEDGVQAAIIEIGLNADYWRFLEQPAMAEALEDAVEGIRELGYVVSRYDQYRDSFPGRREHGPFAQINAEGYPAYCVRREDGSLRPAWPPGVVLNPEMGLRLAKKRIPGNLARYPYNGRFIDCVGTCALWESEDWSEAHPLDAAGGLQARMDLLDFAQSQGLAVGTEGAMDCLLSRLHWVETPMSLVKYTAQEFDAPGWRPVDVSEAYQVSIGTRYRIPFMSLVHHGRAVFTWRWEDPFNRLPQYWQDKNLWSVLYGNPPLFTVDRENYEHWRAEIAQTWRYVCQWTRRVAYARMTSHRFVTPDRHVQETQFSTGDGVVANLGEEPVTLPGGYELPARTYRLFKSDETPRRYVAPPVAEVDYEGRAFEADS